jgi:hypothetical protein
LCIFLLISSCQCIYIHLSRLIWPIWRDCLELRRVWLKCYFLRDSYLHHNNPTYNP